MRMLAKNFKRLKGKSQTGMTQRLLALFSICMNIDQREVAMATSRRRLSIMQQRLLQPCNPWVL